MSSWPLPSRLLTSTGCSTLRSRSARTGVDQSATWRPGIFPDLPQDHRGALTIAVEDCRSAIESHIEATHIRLAGRWTRAEEQQADAWIADQYSWMTRKNRRRAISQGQYYAWHDNG
jgi:hypothetical protein